MALLFILLLPPFFLSHLLPSFISLSPPLFSPFFSSPPLLFLPLFSSSPLHFLLPQSPSHSWQKVEYLLEFGEWLYCHQFPMQDALDQFQEAVHILSTTASGGEEE